MAILDPLLEKIKEEIEKETSRIDSAIKTAKENGNELAVVICSEDTEPGDIIDVRSLSEEEKQNGAINLSSENKEPTKAEARVISVEPTALINTKTEEYIEATSALVVILEEGQLMEYDSFTALYGEETKEPEKEEETPPNTCECGADFSLCKKSQETFGIHINDE